MMKPWSAPRAKSRITRLWPALGVLCALPFLAGCLSFHTGAMPGEPKATYATIDGARLRYVDVGQGPPVVLVHGFASSLETWELLIPELSKKHRVVALDLKGFGWSDRPEGDYSPLAEAKLVLQLLDKLGVERAAFVGHSWGSSVTLALALHAPQRVSRIALYDAWVYEEQLPTTFLMARAGGLGEILFTLFYDQRPDERMALAFYNKDFLSEKLVEDVERALERPGTGAAQLAAVRGQRFTEQQAKYKTVDKPVLLLWGREDVITTLAFGERLSRDLPHARLVVYPRCGHFPMLEAKNESNTEVVKFLDEPEAPATPAPAPAKDEKHTEEKK
ncbi:alpha/beta hydrolase fold protein [Minicystis rosea]|nr:alpha/beta hydrolase fold protein [Minicystis rosea]